VPRPTQGLLTVAACLLLAVLLPILWHECRGWEWTLRVVSAMSPARLKEMTRPPLREPPRIGGGHERTIGADDAPSTRQARDAALNRIDE